MHHFIIWTAFPTIGVVMRDKTTHTLSYRQFRTSQSNKHVFGLREKTAAPGQKLRHRGKNANSTQKCGSIHSCCRSESLTTELLCAWKFKMWNMFLSFGLLERLKKICNFQTLVVPFSLKNWSINSAWIDFILRVRSPPSPPHTETHKYLTNCCSRKSIMSEWYNLVTSCSLEASHYKQAA